MYDGGCFVVVDHLTVTKSFLLLPQYSQFTSKRLKMHTKPFDFLFNVLKKPQLGIL